MIVDHSQPYISPFQPYEDPRRPCTVPATGYVFTTRDAVPSQERLRLTEWIKGALDLPDERAKMLRRLMDRGETGDAVLKEALDLLGDGLEVTLAREVLFGKGAKS